MFTLYSVGVNSDGRVKLVTGSVSVAAATQDIDKYQHNDKEPNLVDNRSAVVCFLLGNSSASEFYMPTFRNTLSVPSS